MGRQALLVLICALLLPVGGARANGVELSTVDAVHRACRDAREGGPPELYVLPVQEGWSFASARDDEGLVVDTRRNLRAFDGRVSLLPARLEPLYLDVDAAELEQVRQMAGTSGLRLGFFLGFDEPDRNPCVIRSAHAVTIVRFDLAFVELVDDGGSAVARHDTDRLRAWRDNRAEDAVPGEGPRGAVQRPRFNNGAPVPEAWHAALTGDAPRAAIARCHADGLARGANPEGQVIVRLNVETRSGRVRRADPALSSIGDEDEASCIARAIGSQVRLPPGPASWNAAAVDLDVPVRLTVR